MTTSKRGNNTSPKGDPNKEPTLKLVSAEDVTAKPIGWCWPNRIPRGMVTLIAGYAKSAKSLLTCKIAAIVTKGGKFPHDEGEAKKGHVIIVNNEDNFQQVQRPRLLAAGADLKRVHTPDARLQARDPSQLIEVLDVAIQKIEHPRLLVLDPLTSVVKIDRNNADAVRRLLNELNVLAAKHNIAVIAVVHLGKNSHGRSAFQVAGSFEWIAACRAGFLVTENPNKAGEHLLLNLGNNLNLTPSGLAFQIDEAVADGARAPTIVWKKKADTLSANEVLAARRKRHSDTTNEAAEFLTETILEPTPAVVALKLGRDAGFSAKELRTARGLIGMTAKREGGVGAKGRWVWAPAKGSARK